MSPRFDTFDTPLGAFTVAVDDQGAVTAAVFGGADALPASIKRDGPTQETKAAASARRQVEYFAGTRQDFDLPLAPHGSEFQTRF